MTNTEYRDRIYLKYVTLQTGRMHSHSLEEYDRLTKFYSKKFMKHLPRDKNARILDLGCGAGFFLYFLKKNGYSNALGLDTSPEQIQLAKSLGLDVLEQDMFLFLREHVSDFDLVFSSHVIEHLNKKEIIDYLIGIYNSLKIGGKTIICTPNSSSLFGFAYYTVDLTHETPFNPISFRTALEACGFKQVQIYPEWPAGFDFQSTVRVFLWNAIKPFIKLLFIIHSGRDYIKAGYLFENYMFAVGVKI